MPGDQQVVIVDQEFIVRAVVNEVCRIGRWDHQRPVHCRLVFGVNVDALPPASRQAMLELLEVMRQPNFPLNYYAELRPMYSIEEVAGAMDCK